MVSGSTTWRLPGPSATPISCDASAWVRVEQGSVGPAVGLPLATSPELASGLADGTGVEVGDATTAEGGWMTGAGWMATGGRVASLDGAPPVVVQALSVSATTRIDSRPCLEVIDRPPTAGWAEGRSPPRSG